jgi:hypothetical protein
MCRPGQGVMVDATKRENRTLHGVADNSIALILIAASPSEAATMGATDIPAETVP